MWHEARKQERRIRGLIVDYRKRAERRQDFYEKIQADPTQFIQLHGRRCKIHLDPVLAAAGDGAAIIVPWQGQQDNLIDRFDVRAHLDYIPVVPKNTTDAADNIELTQEERQLNYERYRILAQNDFLNVTEEKFLHQLYQEEQFGVNAQLEAERALGKKKQAKVVGATIGYSYDDSSESAAAQPFSHLMGVVANTTTIDKDISDESDSDIDMDVAIDIAKLDTAQAHELNACGRNYGMKSNDFYSYLTKDADEADALRIAREEEQEKMLLSGRKSRRERRAQKERRIASRPFSPPSYAAKEESEKKIKEEDSESRSPSPDVTSEKITYITSFGGEDELQPHSKITINLNRPGQTLAESCINVSSEQVGQAIYVQKVKENLDKLKEINEIAKRAARKAERHNRPKSCSRSRSRSRSYSRSRSSHHYKRRIYHRRSRSNSRRRRRYSRSSSREHRYGSCRYRRSRSRSRKRNITLRSSSSRSRSPATKHRRRTAKVKTPTKVIVEQKVPQISSKKSTPVKPIITPVSHPIMMVPQSHTPMISYSMISRVKSQTTTIGSIMATTTEITTETAPSTSATLTILPEVVEPPPPPLKRYYGRKRANDTSSTTENSSESDANGDEPTKTIRSHADDDDDSDENVDVDTTSDRSNPLPSSTSFTTGNQTGKYCSATEIKVISSSGAMTGGRLNLRERLKRKMQNLLNRQYKADKRAEIEKTERERQLQQEREDEMRELALKLRRRQRELRHKYGSPSTEKESDSENASEQTVIKKTKRSKSKRRSSSRDRRRHIRRSLSCGAFRDSRSREHRHSRSRERRHLRSRERRHSRSRERRHSRSRERRHSRSRERRSRGRRSGSRDRRCRSRSRRSQSRRRRRSKSGSRTQRDRSREREHEREHERLRQRNKLERNRERDRERERNRDRQRERAAEVSRSSASSSSNRGKVVISAPPKLKKLVDY